MQGHQSFNHRPEDGLTCRLPDVLVKRVEAFAQGEDAIDILLHDEVLSRLLELDLLHPAVVRLGYLCMTLGLDGNNFMQIYT